MKYMGSKRRIAKHIIPILNTYRRSGQYYVEPFCGGCNVIDKMGGKRIASDANFYLIDLFKRLVNGGPFPSEITEEQWRECKYDKDAFENWFVALAGIACSFGARWFEGYARGKSRNYCIETVRSLEKQKPDLLGIDFYSVNYDSLNLPAKSIVYCDPPYKGSKSYFIKFDTKKFFEWVRSETLKGHLIFISEYEAPDDFVSIWSLDVVSDLTPAGNNNIRTENLFVHESIAYLF